MSTNLAESLHNENMLYFVLGSLISSDSIASKEDAEKAIEKKTGARALRAIIEEFMLDIMYEIPKDDNIGRVTITREYIEGKGAPVIEMRSVDRVHKED